MCHSTEWKSFSSGRQQGLKKELGHACIMLQIFSPAITVLKPTLARPLHSQVRAKCGWLGSDDLVLLILWTVHKVKHPTVCNAPRHGLSHACFPRTAFALFLLYTMYTCIPPVAKYLWAHGGCSGHTHCRAQAHCGHHGPRGPLMTGTVPARLCTRIMHILHHKHTLQRGGVSSLFSFIF